MSDESDISDDEELKNHTDKILEALRKKSTKDYPSNGRLHQWLEKFRDQALDHISPTKKAVSFIDRLLIWKRDVDQALRIQRRLSSGIFFTLALSVAIALVAQVFFKLYQMPLSSMTPLDIMYFSVLPFRNIGWCLLLQASFALMRDSFRRPDLCEYRAELLISCYDMSTRMCSSLEKYFWWLWWCRGIDFWFLWALAMSFLGGLVGIPFFLMYRTAHLSLGVLILSVTPFFLLGILLYWLGPTLLYAATAVLAVAFVLSPFHLPDYGFWGVLDGAVIVGLLWAFVNICLMMVSNLYVSVLRLKNDAQELQSLLHSRLCDTGHMSDESSTCRSFKLRSRSSRGRRRQGPSRKQREGSSPARLEIEVGRDRETLLEIKVQASDSRGIAQYLLDQSLSKLPVWLGFLLACLIWLVALICLYYQCHVVFVFLFGATQTVLSFALNRVWKKRVSVFFGWHSLYKKFLIFFWVEALIMSLILDKAILSTSHSEGGAFMQWQPGQAEGLVDRASYFACQAMWGSQGTGPLGSGLSILDMAALSEYAYVSNESYHDALLRATFGPTAYTIHYEDFSELPRIIGTRFKSRSKDFNDTIVFAIMGTAKHIDWMADFSLYAFVGALQLTSCFINIFAFVPPGCLRRLLVWWNIASDIEQPFRDRLENVSTKFGKDKFPNATILFTGHSLGGSFAAQAGADLHKQAVVFSAPGVHFSRTRFNLTKEGSYRHVLNIVPDGDVVPKVDSQDATVQKILCQNSKGDRLDAVQCHNLQNTICELWRACGDAAGRNFSRQAGWGGVTCDWREQFAYVGID